MTPPAERSKAQARRIALVAQGFRDPRHTAPTMRTFSRTLARTGVLQVDSVNVLQRAHYMPLFSRMGPYDTGMLTRASERAPRRMVEYWAHVQAFMPVELWPVMRHRMDSYRDSARWGEWTRANTAIVDRVLEQVRDVGAATARRLDDGAPRNRDNWGWNWSETRKALDYLWLVGDVAMAGRNGQFEPVYDLPERVLPAEVLAAPVPGEREAIKELLRRSARSHGVATVRCLTDYYRLQLHRDAALPRRVDARALLSPFDPLVWERERTEQIFDFHYRIEIYVPEGKRQYGYYVLPFLLGDRIVGRVDLKADRRGGVLLVKAAYAEPGAPPETAEELAEELRELARWLGLDDIEVHLKGDLAAQLAAVIAR